MKLYAEYKDSGVEWIGKIPNEWEIKKNRYILTRVKNIVGDDEVNYPVLSLSVKGVIEKDRDDNSGKIPVVYADYYQVIQSGNLLLCLFDMDVTPCLVGFIEKTGIISPAYSYFEPFKKGNIYPKYYYYWYLRMHIENLFIKLSNNVRSSINNENFKNIVAPFPPLPVQQAIADYLDQKTSAIDTIIVDKQKLIDLLKERRQAIINEAVTKGINSTVKMKDSGVDWIGEIPEEWGISRIKYLSTLYPKCNTTHISDDTEISFAPMECVKTGCLEKRTELFCKNNSSYNLFENGDILLAKVTPCFENRNIVIADNLVNGLGFGSSELFVFRCHDIQVKYMYYLFQSNYLMSIGKSSMTGVAGLKRVNADYLMNTKVPLPSHREQTKIIRYIDSLTSQIDTLLTDITTQIDKLKEYRQSVISEAVTGKVAI